MRNAKLSTFAERLKQMVKCSDLKRAEIASRIGIAQETLSKYCSGTREPDLATVVALAEILNCDCDYLLTGRDAKYAKIGNTIGLTQEAINNISALKYEISDYAPCVYSDRIRAKAKQARKSGKSDEFEPDIRITNADVLNIAFASESFLKVLIDYLVCPDGFELDAGANLMYPLDDLQDGVVGVGLDTFTQPIQVSIAAREVVNIELLAELSTIRNSVQENIQNILSENGYKTRTAKLHGVKFREWGIDDGREKGK